MNDIPYLHRDFSARFAESLASATGPKRDRYTVLSTAMWVEEIRAMTHCSTYYELEKLFDPEGFNRDEDGNTRHRNKWAKYAVGLHKPSKTMVEKVDQKVSGASKILTHPLWGVLRDVDGVSANKATLIGGLSSDVQKFMGVPSEAGIVRTSKRRLPLSRQLGALEKRAGIDALAALSIMAAEAMTSGHESVISIAISLYRVLLITCIYRPFVCFQNELFTCVRDCILDRVHDDKFRLGMEHVDFSEELLLLTGLKEKEHNAGRVQGEREAIEACAKLLNGKKGYDVLFALNPPRVILDEGQDISESDKAVAGRALRLKEWGLSVLRSGGCEPFPPLEQKDV